MPSQPGGEAVVAQVSNGGWAGWPGGVSAARSRRSESKSRPFPFSHTIDSSE